MELITILNRCHRFRAFVYQHAHFSVDKKSIEAAVRPRKGSAAVCSRCHLPAPGYDQLAERRDRKRTVGLVIGNRTAASRGCSPHPRFRQRLDRWPVLLGKEAHAVV